MFGTAEQKKVIKTVDNVHWISKKFTLTISNYFWRFRYTCF